jgi:hypothetical protein
MSRTSPVAQFRNVNVKGSLRLAGTTLTATAAELNQFAGATATAAQTTTLAAAAGTVTFDRVVKVAKVTLAALDTGGGVLAWQNPEAVSIIVHRLFLNVTTKATSACTVDAGTTATNATTSSDNLIDGLDIGTAAGLFDNLGDAGSNGKAKQLLAAGKWITVSKASGAAAGTIGFCYISYTLI